MNAPVATLNGKMRLWTGCFNDLVMGTRGERTNISQSLSSVALLFALLPNK